MRRAKFILDRRTLHRALGLPADVRVVALHLTNDPDAVHVQIEGDTVPACPMLSDLDAAEMAYHGTTEAPILQHPWDHLHAEFQGWKLGEPVLTGEQWSAVAR